MSTTSQQKKAARKAVAFYLTCASLSVGLPGALFIYLTATYA